MNIEDGQKKKGMFGQVRQFTSDQKKFMISQIVSAVYNNIISGVLMTGFLLYIGVPNAGVGVILSIPLLAAPFWGRTANRISWKNILKLVSVGLGIQFLVWSFVTVHSIGVILIIFITSGLMATGLVTSQFMIPYAYLKPQKAVIYLSLTTGIAACGGFLGSIIGAFVIASLSSVRWNILGVEFGSMQINMAVSGAMILGMSLYGRIVLRDEIYGKENR